MEGGQKPGVVHAAPERVALPPRVSSSCIWLLFSKSGSTAGANVLFHGMGTEKQRDKEVMSQRQAMANQ